MQSAYFYMVYVLLLVNFSTIYYFLRCMALLSADFCRTQMPYLAVLAKEDPNALSFSVTQIHTKNEWILLCPMPHPATKLHANYPRSF